MSFDLELRAPRRAQRPLRVCLDANVWVSYLAATAALRQGVPAELVDLIEAGDANGLPLQLFLSLELLDTIRVVLRRLEVAEALVDGFIPALEGLMATGPERLQPPLLLSGRDQLPMRDREDAGVLAACFAGNVELLVTDNLDTQIATRRDGSTRQLYALIHEPVGYAALVVLHPIDALEWLVNGDRPTADDMRAIYGDVTE